MKTIKKAVDIQASGENIWKVLIEDQYNRRWFAEFGAGSHAIGDWKQGSKIIFKDASGNGLIGKIVQYQPHRFIDIEYTGIVMNNKEEYTHPHATQIKGGHETYTLSDTGNILKLSVTSDMSEEFIDTMNKAWDKALEEVKKLSENLEN